MSTDTRPSVTVTGIMDQDCLGWFTIDLDAGGDFLRELGFRDGDEVEVTIRKHERVEEWPRRGRGGTTEEEISEFGIEPDGY